jgi:ABC-type lipoprotein export system ATPase subunit
MDADAIVQAEHLSKVYTTGTVKLVALDDVTLSVHRGRFVGVTGASGSGKSTLINLLGGLDTPSSGSLVVEGRCISDLNRDELALYRRETVGMIFQSFNLVSSYTAHENVALPLLFAGVAKRRRVKRAEELLGTVNLAERREHKPGELSGGEQQRVAIARALVNEPRILLADEPTGNLDSRTSRQIVQSLADLHARQDVTVIMVSHEESLLREFADEIVCLEDGRIVKQETLSRPDAGGIRE